jgi:hypothetical protein
MQGRGRIDPGAVIRPDPGEWHPRMPERLGENELSARCSDPSAPVSRWRTGRPPSKLHERENPRRGEPGFSEEASKEEVGSPVEFLQIDYFPP